ncbi:hypothetical protein PF011_g17173 [Phytophthora fragariae]|uniref:Uncharacterized protein n=1 Tax=Phytophthora fragariae TaxID=53985 RepID=A0A6A3JLK7_9STRA|nr:hypothetical protein PF011_g17173 [Phytophthora fragariae]
MVVRTARHALGAGVIWTGTRTSAAAAETTSNKLILINHLEFCLSQTKIHNFSTSKLQGASSILQNVRSKQ